MRRSATVLAAGKGWVLPVLAMLALRAARGCARVRSRPPAALALRCAPRRTRERRDGSRPDLSTRCAFQAPRVEQEPGQVTPSPRSPHRFPPQADIGRKAARKALDGFGRSATGGECDLDVEARLEPFFGLARNASPASVLPMVAKAKSVLFGSRPTHGVVSEARKQSIRDVVCVSCRYLIGVDRSEANATAWPTAGKRARTHPGARRLLQAARARAGTTMRASSRIRPPTPTSRVAVVVIMAFTGGDLRAPGEKPRCLEAVSRHDLRRL